MLSNELKIGIIATMKLRLSDFYDKNKSFIFSKHGVLALNFKQKSSEMIQYSDIESCDISLTATEDTCKGSTYTHIREIYISLKTANGYYALTSSGSYSKLFKLIDCRKFFGSFRLYAEGPERGIDIPIKIYSKFGLKLPIKNSDRIINFELISMLIPIMTILYFFFQKNIYPIELECLIFMTLVALALILPCVYQEFIKFKIRKLLNL